MTPSCGKIALFALSFAAFTHTRAAEETAAKTKTITGPFVLVRPVSPPAPSCGVKVRGGV